MECRFITRGLSAESLFFSIFGRYNAIYNDRLNKKCSEGSLKYVVSRTELTFACFKKGRCLHHNLSYTEFLHNTSHSFTLMFFDAVVILYTCSLCVKMVCA